MSRDIEFRQRQVEYVEEVNRATTILMGAHGNLHSLADEPFSPEAEAAAIMLGSIVHALAQGDSVRAVNHLWPRIATAATGTFDHMLNETIEENRERNSG